MRTKSAEIRIILTRDGVVTKESIGVKVQVRVRTTKKLAVNVKTQPYCIFPKCMFGGKHHPKDVDGTHIAWDPRQLKSVEDGLGRKITGMKLDSAVFYYNHCPSDAALVELGNGKNVEIEGLSHAGSDHTAAASAAEAARDALVRSVQPIAAGKRKNQQPQQQDGVFNLMRGRDVEIGGEPPVAPTSALAVVLHAASARRATRATKRGEGNSSTPRVVVQNAPPAATDTFFADLIAEADSFKGPYDPLNVLATGTGTGASTSKTPRQVQANIDTWTDLKNHLQLMSSRSGALKMTSTAMKAVNTRVSGRIAPDAQSRLEQEGSLHDIQLGVEIQVKLQDALPHTLKLERLAHIFVPKFSPALLLPTLRDCTTIPSDLFVIDIDILHMFISRDIELLALEAGDSPIVWNRMRFLQDDIHKDPLAISRTMVLFSGPLALSAAGFRAQLAECGRWRRRSAEAMARPCRRLGHGRTYGN